MPAAPVGSVWATGSWSDTAWEANAWADAVEPEPQTSVTGYAAWQSAVMASLWLLWVRLSQ
jgi:hypothetical protein